MHSRNKLYSWPLMVMLLALGQAASQVVAANEDDPRISEAKRLWDVEEVLDEHIDRVSRHYQLNQDQRAKTSRLLADRVYKFLDKHDKEIWPLLLDLYDLNGNGQSVDPELARRIGTKGHRIFMDARKEILQGQEAFREYLDDRQKEIHDRDLRSLEYHFNQWDKQFKSYRSGNTSGRAPLSNVQLGERRLVRGTEGRSGMSLKLRTESKWDRYVRNFVRDYQLDEKQKSKALAILAETKSEAEKYRAANKKDIEDAQRDLVMARRAKPADRTALKQAEFIWNILHQPLDDMFARLKGRLDQIPTEKQKAEHFKRYPKRRPQEPKVTPIKQEAESKDKSEPAEKPKTPAAPAAADDKGTAEKKEEPAKKDD